MSTKQQMWCAMRMHIALNALRCINQGNLGMYVVRCGAEHAMSGREFGPLFRPTIKYNLNINQYTMLHT